MGSQSNANGAPLLPVAFDRHAEAQLAQVRLVGELDLGGPLYERSSEIVADCQTLPDLLRLARTSPVTFVVYLVGSGSQHYADRGYWKQIKLADQDPAKQRQLGQAFEEALRKLELETFAEAVAAESGERYVMPILLHGTVPRRDVRQLAEALVAELNDGAAGVDDVLAFWRQGGSRLDKLRRPAQRFVRYGGPYVADLLERVRDALAGAGDDAAAGLPSYVAEELAGLGTRGVTVARPRGLRHPEVVFDPWDGTGPELVLPSGNKVDRWVVSTDGVQERYPAAKLRDEHVLLAPGSGWQVEGRANDGVVSRRAFRGGGGKPVFFFDSVSLRLLSDQSQASGDAVVVLMPHSSTLRRVGETKDARPAEDHPHLADAWSGFRSMQVATGEQDAIEIRMDDESSVICSTSDRRARAVLLGQPVRGVQDLEGRVVYDSLPLLHLPPGSDPARWTVAVITSSTASCCVVDLPQSDLGFDLRSLAGEPRCTALTIRARGPLGADLVADLVVVDGLRFDTPGSPVEPNASLSCRVVTGGSVEVTDLPGGQLRFDAGVDSLVREVHELTGQVKLRFQVPRLLWSLSSGHDPEVRDGADQFHVEPEAFDDPRLQLAVRTGADGDVTVKLAEPDGTVVQVLPPRRVSRSHGRARIALRSMADTVRASDAEKLLVSVATGELDVVVGFIERRLVIEGLIADVRGGGGVCGLQLHWQQSGPLLPRQVRLWPEDRPWELPEVVGLSQDVDAEVFLKLSDRVSAGAYLVELVATDAVMVAPAMGDAWVDRVVVPDRPDVVSPDFGGGPIGEVLAGNRAAHDLTVDDLNEGDERVVRVFLGAAGAVSDEADFVRQRALELLFSDERDSAHAAGLLVDATHFRRLSKGDRVVLGIETVRSAVDCPTDALTARQCADLWESNRILAAALDRPTADPDRGDRWLTHTGWSPGSGYPHIGRPYPEPLLRWSLERLQSKAASDVAQTARLLSTNGFDVANIEWLIATSGARDLITDWWAENRDGWSRGTQRTFPSVAVEHLRQTYPKASSSPELRFPSDVTAAAFQYVFYGGNEAAARRALLDAVTFAPHLVERQLLVAIVHHLAAIGAIQAKRKDRHRDDSP